MMSARLISLAGSARRSRRRRRDAAQQAAAGELAHQFLRGRKRNAGLARQLGRAQARAFGPAGGGGHHHDRIIGKVGQAHVLIRSFPVRFSTLRRETQPLAGRREVLDCVACVRNDRWEVVALYPLIRPLAFALDAETAHRATIAALKLMPHRAGRRDFAPSLRDRRRRPRLPNPVGLAAGFDKDAEVPDQMLGLGFGFVEVGTVTPRPQHGNPKPRLFRLAEDRAVINRMGFNNRRPACGVRAAERVPPLAWAWSGSISAPTRTAPTASPIMSAGVSRRWPPVARLL